MELAKTLIIIFLYGYFILLVGIIGLVNKKPPKNKNLINWIKVYWNEVFFMLCMVLGAYFFIKGVI